MNRLLQSVWDVIRVIIWPVLLGIGQFLIAFILTYAYLTIHQISDVSDVAVQRELNQFIADYTWIVFLWNMLLIFLFSFFYKKSTSRKKQRGNIKEFFLIAMIGIGLTVTSDIVLQFLFPVTVSSDIHYHLWMQILTIGITGPILEELVFRGIMFEELKKQFSGFWPALIVTLIFAFCHQGISQIIYALIMGTLFIWIYMRTGNLKLSMFAHISANISTLCLASLSFPSETFLAILLLIFLVLFGISFYFFVEDSQKIE